MNIFKQYFERYLNARKSKNLFRRRSILESMPREKRQQRPSDTLNRRLLSEARLDLPQLLAQLGTSVQGRMLRRRSCLSSMGLTRLSTKVQYAGGVTFG